MSSATASVSKFEIKHPPLFAHWCTNFVIYSNPQKTGVVNPLSEVQLSIMLNLLIILLATICVATGNLDSNETNRRSNHGTVTDTKIKLLCTITSVHATKCLVISKK